MVPLDENRRRRAVREAVHCLRRTVRTLRQHEAAPRLCAEALAGCVRDLVAAAAPGPIALRLAAGSVSCGDEPLLAYLPGELPFGALAAAGIGELVVPEALDEAAAERLVRALATAAPAGDPDADAAEALRAADVPGLQFRAAAVAPPDDAPGERPDWWLLPPPGPAARALRPLIERDRDANLPAAAVRLLLADLDGAAGPSALPRLLEGLAAALLVRGDAGTLAALLEQTDRHPAVPADVAARLRDRAAAACGGEWLAQQLERPGQLQHLVALAMQLGERPLQHLAAAAAAAGQPLPAWLLEFVPPA